MKRRLPGARGSLCAMLVLGLWLGLIIMSGGPAMFARADVTLRVRPASAEKALGEAASAWGMKRALKKRQWENGTFKLSEWSPGVARIERLRRLGVVCKRCCFVPKELEAPEQSRRKGQDFFLRRGRMRESNVGVRLWEAGARERLLPGVTHVAWLFEHSNLLFNFAAAYNAWRTWTDLDVPVDRVMLLRRPRLDLQWVFNQLRGLTNLATPEVVQRPLCFETLVLGLVREPLRPFDWPTKCKPNTRMTREEEAMFGRFAAYLQHSIPAGGRRAGARRRCRALVQLRGARQGPEREPRGRNWLNAHAAAGMLRDLGFEVDAVELRGTPLQRAAALHSSADLVLAPHGAGMANILFCRPGTAVVEMQNYGAQKWVYRRIASSLRLVYRPHVCSHPSQCPLTGEDGNPIPEPEVTKDLCQRGIHVPRPWYESNHTRDINVDLSAIQRIAIRAALELRSSNRCKIDIKLDPKRFRMFKVAAGAPRP